MFSLKLTACALNELLDEPLENRLWNDDLGEILLHGLGGWTLRLYGVEYLICCKIFGFLAGELKEKRF